MVHVKINMKLLLGSLWVTTTVPNKTDQPIVVIIDMPTTRHCFMVSADFVITYETTSMSVGNMPQRNNKVIIMLFMFVNKFIFCAMILEYEVEMKT